jgi:hypothetical protein
MTNPFADHQHYLPDGRSNSLDFGRGFFIQTLIDGLTACAWAALGALLFVSVFSPILVWALFVYGGWPMAYKFNNSLTAERLRELLDYDQHSGVFTWKVRTTTRRGVGDVAGSLTKPGYISIRVDKTRYQAHRLAWLYVHGRWPVEEIDHVNGDRSDNRIVNLREADRAQNARNVVGARGYSISPSGTFLAQLSLNGRTIYLGAFKTADEARAAYMAGRRLYFTDRGSDAEFIQN